MSPIKLFIANRGQLHEALSLPSRDTHTLILAPGQAATSLGDLAEMLRKYECLLVDTSEGGSLPDGSIPFSKLADEQEVQITLLGQDAQPLDERERSILDRIILVPKTTTDEEDLANAIVLQPMEEQVSGKTAAPAVSTADELAPVPGGVHITIWEEALEAVRDHAWQEKHHEVGGVCVGRKHKDPSGQWFVEITATIAGEHMDKRGAAVTFNPATWHEFNLIIDRQYEPRGHYMVGWYHSHPGFGIFMSGDDRFIHEFFFAAPWQIALVVDPTRPRAGNEDIGFFAWIDRGKERSLEQCKKIQLKIMPGKYSFETLPPPPEDPGAGKQPAEPPKREEAFPPGGVQRAEGEVTPPPAAEEKPSAPPAPLPAPPPQEAASRPAADVTTTAEEPAPPTREEKAAAITIITAEENRPPAPPPPRPAPQEGPVHPTGTGVVTITKEETRPPAPSIPPPSSWPAPPAQLNVPPELRITEPPGPPPGPVLPTAPSTDRPVLPPDLEDTVEAPSQPTERTAVARMATAKFHQPLPEGDASRAGAAGLQEGQQKRPPKKKPSFVGRVRDQVSSWFHFRDDPPSGDRRE